MAVILLPACYLEQPEREAGLGTGETTTIHAGVPSSKVVLSPDGSGLHLAWESGDCLRVMSGTRSERFDIKEGFSDHEADFTGTALSGGGSFDVMYPGTFTSVTEAEASDFGLQTQTGNGSTAHLRYAALLSGVDDYTDIVFSDAWAAAHGGTFKRSGALRLVLTLPGNAGALDKVSVSFPGHEYSLALSGVDVSQDSQVLTAYIMTAWDDIALPANSEIDIRVTGTDLSVYGTTLKLETGATLLAGHVSNFSISKGIEEYPFAGGSGTPEDPWLIANARHLQNMSDLYRDAAGSEVSYCFKQIADIDASGVSWTPLNWKSPYKEAIHYDGDGHVISSLSVVSSSDYGYPSFAGVLNGSISDLTFDGAAIDAGNAKAGVVAGFVGTTGITGSCSGVTVRNSSVKGTHYVGGFAGQVACEGTLSDCHVTDVTVVQNSATANRCAGGFAGYAGGGALFDNCTAQASVTSGVNYAGGFTGFVTANASFRQCTARGDVSGVKQVAGFAAYAEKATFEDCSYLGGTLTDSFSGKSAQSGGFAGMVASGVNLRRCSVREAVLAMPQAQRIGGFIGQLGNLSSGKNADLVENCSVINCTITAGALSGGFVGVQYNDIDRCGVSGGSITFGGTNSGAFTGFVQNGNCINCFTTMDANAGANSPAGGFVGIAYTATFYSCYTAGNFSASGAQAGAFVGTCAVEGSGYPANIFNCIAWNASLPFCASNTVEATLTDNYCGTAGTVSSQASALAWNGGIWDLSGALPALKAGASSGVSVAFIGDSITWQWSRSGFHPEYFASNGYVNKGISGENTTEMLARYDYDIIALRPRIVVIMGGTNDIAQGVTQDGIMANLKAMAERAQAAGIKVVLCSVTPCNRTYSSVGGPKTLAILPLNEAIKAYAAGKGFPYCNYYPVLADENDGLRAEYMKNGTDDLHPNREGYLAMEAVIEPIIDNLIN